MTEGLDDYTQAIFETYVPTERMSDGNERATRTFRDVNLALDGTRQAHKEAGEAANDHAKDMAQLENTFISFVHSVDENIKAAYEYAQVTELLRQAQEELGLSAVEAQELLDKYLVSTSQTATEAVRDVEYAHRQIANSAGRASQELSRTLMKGFETGKVEWSNFVTFAISEIAKIITQLLVMNALKSGAAASSATSTATAAGGGANALGSFSAGGATEPLSLGTGNDMSFSNSTEINIMGNADASTVQALNNASEGIVRQTKNEILSEINNGGAFARATGRRS